VLDAMKYRYGKTQAITRDELALQVTYRVDRVEPVDDRTIRDAIEQLRQSHPVGALIVSSPSWSGYWLAEDVDEVREFVQRKRKTAAKLFAAAKKQVALAGAAPPPPDPQLKLVLEGLS
jgi:hypothetical protein